MGDLNSGQMTYDATAPMREAHERAFRACVEALIDVDRDMEDGYTGELFLSKATRKKVRAALALARAADSPTTEGT